MQKKTILLIDDEKDLILLMKMNLEKTGRFEVLIASDGATGIKIAKEKHPDYILCDVLMPGMSGSEVAQALRENRHTKDIPVIFLTAVATREEVANKIGIDGRYYMAKPATTQDIIAVIDSLGENM